MHITQILCKKQQVNLAYKIFMEFARIQIVNEKTYLGWFNIIYGSKQAQGSLYLMPCKKESFNEKNT